MAVVRRWLEVLLPLYTLGFVFVWFHQEYMPAVLAGSMSESPLPWLGWAVVGGMTGILTLWTLIVAFFLSYSPFYLLGKLPALVDRQAWVDQREVKFYGCCFVLLCLLIALSYWDGWTALMAFILVSGCGPVFWRYLV
jgi:hypothetical protein